MPNGGTGELRFGPRGELVSVNGTSGPALVELQFDPTGMEANPNQEIEIDFGPVSIDGEPTPTAQYGIAFTLIALAVDGFSPTPGIPCPWPRQEPRRCFLDVPPELLPEATLGIGGDRYVRHSSGARVQGYRPDPVDSAPTATIEDIAFPLTPLPPVPTSWVDLAVELDAATPRPAIVPFNPWFPSESWNFAVAVDLVDSLGASYLAAVLFAHVGPRVWQWSVALSGTNARGPFGTRLSPLLKFDAGGRLVEPDGRRWTSRAFDPIVIASGVLEFDVDGNLAEGDGTTSLPFDVVFDTPHGALTPQTAVLDFQSASARAAGAVTVQVNASSQIKYFETDGGPPSTPTGLQRETDGLVAATYTDGRSAILAWIAPPGPGDLVCPSACVDGVDNDHDGFADYPEDPGCADPQDDWEHSPQLTCDDGLDNDRDCHRDYPADPGCASPEDPVEDGGIGVEIDITPRLDDNRIVLPPADHGSRRGQAWPRPSRGATPRRIVVAILGSARVAVEEVDVDSLAFGPSGAPAVMHHDRSARAHRRMRFAERDSGHHAAHRVAGIVIEDVNQDGFSDWLVKFDVQ